MDIMFFEQRAHFEQRHRHRHTQRLRFFAARDNAAIVIRQHDNGLIVQMGLKQSFATGVEVVAIDESINWFHGLRNEWITLVATPKISRSAPSGILMSA